MDKTAVVYIAGAWHNSVTLDISVDENWSKWKNISNLRNHLVAELFLGVGIKRSKIMFFKT